MIVNPQSATRIREYTAATGIIGMVIDPDTANCFKNVPQNPYLFTQRGAIPSFQDRIPRMVDSMCGYSSTPIRVAV